MKIKRKRKKSVKVRTAPGSLVFTGEVKLDNAFVKALYYNVEKLQEIKQEDIFNEDRHDSENLWVDVRGLHDIKLIEKLGEKFKIHPLVLEDILDVGQRPKLEEYETGLYFILNNLVFDKTSSSIKSEQVSFYLTKNKLVSFQEDADDLFSNVRERLFSGRTRIRSRSADYLLYALLDSIVDGYFLTLDDFEVMINNLDDRIVEDTDENIKYDILHFKRELIFFRRNVVSAREALSKVLKLEETLIEKKNVLFYRDIYDHLIHILDMTEAYRDTLSGLQDLYLSELSKKMNSVMQVLTIIATIFIPLTFLAGIYGMNFANMPELNYQYGYYILLLVMLVITLFLIRYFRVKKWL
ncbi:MAG: magnesium/cobalt transporter CorA [Bacteroidia bacterium]|nr:magnesium/cobalt transporter CorA [Bacteroidia bacterium]